MIISEKDPGLELADAGLRPAEMLSQKEIREHNLKTIKLDNELDKALNERNLEKEINLPKHLKMVQRKVLMGNEEGKENTEVLKRKK